MIPPWSRQTDATSRRYRATVSHLEPAMQTVTTAPVQAEMNVTPMIDVLLVLLIIYMIVPVRHVVPATLPEPAAGVADPAPPLVLDVRSDGSFALNSQPVPLDALDATLRAAFSGRAEKLLFVRGSAERPYQEIVSAMDVARGAGAQLLAIMPRGDSTGP
jgi:biopolymer transport protein TolR